MHRRRDAPQHSALRLNDGHDSASIRAAHRQARHCITGGTSGCKCRLNLSPRHRQVHSGSSTAQRQPASTRSRSRGALLALGRIACAEELGAMAIPRKSPGFSGIDSRGGGLSCSANTEENGERKWGRRHFNFGRSRRDSLVVRPDHGSRSRTYLRHCGCGRR